MTASYADYYYGSYGSASLTFALLKQEIDAGRPLVLCVDSTGDGVTDHAVVGIGYRETSGYPEYACWDTWSRSVRWERFRALSDSLRLGRLQRDLALAGPTRPARRRRWTGRRRSPASAARAPPGAARRSP